MNKRFRTSAHGLVKAVLLGILCHFGPASADTYTASRTTSFSYVTSGTQSGFLASETVQPDDPATCSTKSYTYDSFGNRTQIATANCATATNDVRFPSRQDVLQFNAQTVNVGLTSFSVAPGTFVNRYTNTLGHQVNVQNDPRFGSVLNSTDANGLTTRWTTDDLGRPVKLVHPDGTSDVVAYCTIAAGGGVDAADTSNSNTSAGDPIGCPNPSNQEMPATAASFSHRESWDASGRKMGGFVRTYWDRLGRAVRRVLENFDGPQQPNPDDLVVVDEIYDAYGSVALSTQPYFLSKASSTTTGSADMGVRRVDYDLLWRPTAIYRTDPSGNQASISFGDYGVRRASSETYVYAALKTTATNDLGQAKVVEQTVVGQQLRVTDPSGAQLVHQHDAFGNLVTSKDGLQNVISMSYDPLGRKLQMSDPDSGSISYRYDALGQLIWQQSALQLARNSSTTMAYDALGRLVSRNESAEYQSTWTYDHYADASQCLQGIGKLCESHTSTGVGRKYSYDALGRPSSNLLTADSGPSFGHSVTYDASTGKVSTLTYPTGLKVAYRYTRGRRLLQQLLLVTQATVTPLPATSGGAAGASVQLPANSVLWSATTVNAWGVIDGQTFGNGVSDQVALEASTGRPLSRTAGLSTGKDVLNQKYAWDGLGRMVGREEINADGSYGLIENFEYGDDASAARNVDRLTKYSVFAPAIPNSSRVVTMKYNAIGLLLQKSDVGDYFYGAQGAGAARPHAVQYIDSASGTVAYARDANGNVVSGDAAKFKSITYNSFNLPDSQEGIQGPNGNSRYLWQYDEAGARVKETRTNTSGTRTTWYVHPDNVGSLSFESEESEGVTSNRHFLMAGNGSVGVLVTQGALPTLAAGQWAPTASSSMQVVKLEYWHKNHQGSVAATTDHVGAVTARYSYDPFGKRRFVDGNYDLANSLVVNWGISVNAGTRRGFTEHEHLDELGLIHMNGRLFDPTTAQFLQADPIVANPLDLQAYNRYAYCQNNPLNCTDPSGFTQKETDAPIAMDGNGTMGGISDFGGYSGYSSSGVRNSGSIPTVSTGVVVVIPGSGVYYGSSAYTDANGCTVIVDQQQLAGPDAVAAKPVEVTGSSFKTYLSGAQVGQITTSIGSNIPGGERGGSVPSNTQSTAQSGSPTLNGGNGSEPNFKQWAKNSLTAASFIPGLQSVTGLGLAAWDLADGDYVSAGLGLITIVPGLGEGAATARATRLLLAETKAAKGVGKYEVGAYDALKSRSVAGDGLDIHHAMQKNPAGQAVGGYNPANGPSIAVPRGEHSRIPTIKGEYTGSARDLLAKDIRDLRNYTNAPNSSLRELIDLNKQMYPGAFGR